MNLKRSVGFLLLVGAAAGFIFSIVGQYEIWHYRPVVTQTVIDTLALFDQTLKTTQDGLVVVDQIVQTTGADVTGLRTTTQALAKTLHDTTPMLDSLTGLIGKDFPTAILATQTSLASAQSSALLIDNVLATLTSIPFLPMTPYQPVVPLHTSLAQVSSSMDPLTPALTTISSSLAAGKTNLGLVEVEIGKISETTQEVSDALGSAQTVIGQYKTVTTQLKARVEAAQLAAIGWITTITLILSFMFGWLLIAQLGLFTQGLGMLRDHAAARSTAGIEPSLAISDVSQI